METSRTQTTTQNTRKTSTIPFGYKLDENKKTLLPIPEELEAYTKAKDYLQSCSYREVASWLTATTGRKISAQGLRKKVLGEKSE
jgi:hypothetical protein|tara:strand:+ start:4286 stop:4540 length:255 start_codon:yes stop_codon:yes gene_type:complete